ncbi:hypothetical protein TWF281_009801 [Arthrobotrys megalospora]
MSASSPVTPTKRPYYAIYQEKSSPFTLVDAEKLVELPTNEDTSPLEAHKRRCKGGRELRIREGMFTESIRTLREEVAKIRAEHDSELAGHRELISKLNTRLGDQDDKITTQNLEIGVHKQQIENQVSELRVYKNQLETQKQQIQDHIVELKTHKFLLDAQALQTEAQNQEIISYTSQVDSLKSNVNILNEKLSTLEPISNAIRLRAMKDLLLGCTGQEEKNLTNAPELSTKAKEFWSGIWDDHDQLMLPGMSRPMNINRGTIRNLGDLAAHGCRVLADADIVQNLEDAERSLAAAEGFRLIYHLEPAFYLKNPAFGPLGNMHGLVLNRLHSKKVQPVNKAKAVGCLKDIRSRLNSATPLPAGDLDILIGRVNAALFQPAAQIQNPVPPAPQTGVQPDSP